MKLAATLPKDKTIVSLSGRGDKDTLDFVARKTTLFQTLNFFKKGYIEKLNM